MLTLRSVLAPAALLTLAIPGTTGAAEGPPSPICTDRPTKSIAACVVDQGLLQVETDVVNVTRLTFDGTTTETWLVTNPTLKYGVAQDVDIEANVAPWTIVRTRDAGGGTSIVRGTGDLYLRVKWNFLPAGDGKLSIAALPSLKVPTARRGIGNRAVEEGVLMPVNFQMSDRVVLTTVPEVDALKDSNGTGRHVNTAQLVNIAYTLSGGITLYGELWGAWNFDPAGIVRQYSADVAVAWGVTKMLQVDAGFNAGLNRATPRLQAYVGVSQKF